MRWHCLIPPPAYKLLKQHKDLRGRANHGRGLCGRSNQTAVEAWVWGSSYLRVFVQTGVLPLASIPARTWASIKYRFQALLRLFVPSPSFYPHPPSFIDKPPCRSLPAFIAAFAPSVTQTPRCLRPAVQPSVNTSLLDTLSACLCRNPLNLISNNTSRHHGSPR